MPPRKIIDLPGELHFVTFSTHQRRRFLVPEKTRSIVLETLDECLRRQGTSCHGFVIMPNHVHAILSMPPGSRITAFLLAWKKTSSYRIKKFYVRELVKYHDLCTKDCPIWQARFYDFNLSDTHKLDEKLDYMHTNLVTAGHVSTALDWKWSSARFYEYGENIGVNITPLL